jgi:IS30 family transposase
MYKHVNHHELYYIWLNRVNKLTKIPVKKIAEELKRHRSTIYRAIAYIKANNWSPFQNDNTFRKRNKPKFNKLTTETKKHIEMHLKIGWSPEVISGRMKQKKKNFVSCKTLYRYIWQDKADGGSLYKSLPHRGKKYKYGSKHGSKIVNRRDINERPTIVEQKTRIGDFEGDTIVGLRGGDKACVMTLVDRVSKFTMIRKIPNKTAFAVESAMNDCYDNTIIPIITITYDNGTEFANHENIAKNLGCEVYFARPYKSCDRGLNEHTNGKIRWFFPKKTDFGDVTEDEIEYVQNLLNDRPRKSLNYLTPNEVVNKHLNKAYKRLSRFT